MEIEYTEISKLFDHTLLSPNLSEGELIAGCRLACRYDVASVCILPYYLKQCGELLAESTVLPSTVIGFPLGAHAANVKAAEAEQALEDGCRELDLVVNISQVKSGNWNYVRSEIAAVVDVAHAAGQRVKVIFENCYLDEAEKIHLCEICGELRADWVKTSTGFGSGGATLEDVLLMRKHAPPAVQVKASGGIRDLDTVLAFRAAGATRIGCSRTAEILDAFKTSGK